MTTSTLEGLLGSMLNIHDLTRLTVSNIGAVAKIDSLVEYLADAYQLPDDYRGEFDKLPHDKRNKMMLTAVFAFFLNKLGIYDITKDDPEAAASKIPDLFERHGMLFMANALMMTCTRKDLGL